MGHTPNAEKGMAIIVGQNNDILEAIAAQSDIAIAKQDKDRDASLAAIKERHKNELKSAKRNHKHRANKIKKRMEYFEAMDPVELADMFKNGVPEGTVSVPFSNGHRDFQVDAITTLMKMDFAKLEHRLMHSIPNQQTIPRGPRWGKTAEHMRRYGLSEENIRLKMIENKPLRREWSTTFGIETAS